MAGALWEVVGGGEKGGIVARRGQQTDSALIGERLATGAVVRELALEGERLRYELVEGAGPAAGWVSLRLSSGRELLARLAGPPSRPPGEPRREPVAGRKARVLALHGAPGNSNIMRFQTGQLARCLGRDFEWAFPDGCVAWEPVPGYYYYYYYHHQ